VNNGHLLEDRIAKLPAWVREHIEMLERQREEAVRKLVHFTEEQKPQPFYVEDMVCLTKGAPQRMRRYVHAYRLNFNHRGLTFSLTMRDDGVTLQYGQEGGLRDIMCQPTSYQSFNLKYPESGT
jgi:hypothetical protein